MRFIADFHIHSRYSRATAKNITINNLALWAKIKGIDLLGTGDFTHPLWLNEIEENLQYNKKTGLFEKDNIKFILSAEIANIFSQNDRVYKIHNIILVPSLEIAKEINKRFSFFGNLSSDGRPIFGKINCVSLAGELFKISQDIMLIPAHIWTPWFSVFGSNSGFDSIEEAYGEYSGKITALETGLSSDPAMNWQISGLDKYSLVSNSDAHSLNKLGREANVFDCEMNYWAIKKALETKDKTKFLQTIEFFPQEGKYHYDGHRACNIIFHPEQTKKNNGICPVCNKPLTKGVLYRVNSLADRPESFVPPNSIPYKKGIPLQEIIAFVLKKGVNTKTTTNKYEEIINKAGPELDILYFLEEKELIFKIDGDIAEAILNVRKEKVNIIPGYDGEYGKIEVEQKQKTRQQTLF
ncbi:MAG: endonuclease Q family protein [Candidatus Omnitrophica bacterium]|nr:endonuclease Q family protein [Candidatus Omnitrophota bacterium]MDD5081376.1 endonuclease Q family protein [Candidatus Omnitrophota bacterium]